jgi:hypothetical protein
MQNVFTLLADDSLRIVTQPINNIYETAEWPKGFTYVTIIALKKKPKATKCSDHRTISLITHTANIVVTIPRRIQRKTEDVLRDQCAFRR